jgi:hypothetical protein
LVLSAKSRERGFAIAEQEKGGSRIEPSSAMEEDDHMKKLVLFCDSCIYIQTTDEEKADTAEE